MLHQEKSEDYADLAFVWKHTPIPEEAKIKIEELSGLVLEVSTLVSPSHSTFYPIQDMYKFSHGGRLTFCDPRFRATIDGVVESTKSARAGQVTQAERKLERLALCILYAGAYRTFVLGRFFVARRVGSTRVEVLNGYSRVEDVETADSLVPPKGGLYC